MIPCKTTVRPCMPPLLYEAQLAIFMHVLRDSAHERLVRFYFCVSGLVESQSVPPRPKSSGEFLKIVLTFNVNCSGQPRQSQSM